MPFLWRIGMAVETLALARFSRHFRSEWRTNASVLHDLAKQTRADVELRAPAPSGRVLPLTVLPKRLQIRRAGTLNIEWLNVPLWRARTGVDMRWPAL